MFVSEVHSSMAGDSLVITVGSRHHCVHYRSCSMGTSSSTQFFSQSPLSALSCFCLVHVFWLRAWLCRLWCCLTLVLFFGMGAIQLGSCLSDNPLPPLLVLLAVRVALNPAVQRLPLSSLRLRTRDSLKGSGWGGRQAHWNNRHTSRLPPTLLSGLRMRQCSHAIPWSSSLSVSLESLSVSCFLFFLPRKSSPVVCERERE